jgi:putative transposase
MPQSLTKLYVHIVFSTKNRIPLITDELAPELYSYLGGTLNQLECTPIRINGHLDHIHILCCLSKKITVIKLLQEIKQSSSKWAKTKGIQYKNFYWQDGYGAFTVSAGNITRIVRYVENQKEHHRKKTFQKEYIGLLEKYGVEYDIRYVWD